MPAVEYEHDALLLGASGRTLSTQPGIYKGHKQMTRKALKKPIWFLQRFSLKKESFQDFKSHLDHFLLSTRSCFVIGDPPLDYYYALGEFTYHVEQSQAGKDYYLSSNGIFCREDGREFATDGDMESYTVPFILMPKSRV